MALRILSAGAAQGVVTKLAAQSGTAIDAAFSAVGAMKQRLLDGEPCDLVILSAKLIEELIADGHVVAETRRDLGRVRTGIAVRAGDPLPGIADADALRASLLAADAIYHPDPKLATAGIHFIGVLAKLGISEAVTARLRPFPNGATAMRELAQAKSSRPIGCTQITEINNTPGVVLVGPLPAEFELATVYSLAVCARAAAPEAARAFAALLTGAESREVREMAGFEL